MSDAVHVQAVRREASCLMSFKNCVCAIVFMCGASFLYTSLTLTTLPPSLSPSHSAMTNMNEHSSRSHMMLTVTVISESKLNGAVTRGKLNLVDLAGSERLNKSGE